MSLKVQFLIQLRSVIENEVSQNPEFRRLRDSGPFGYVELLDLPFGRSYEAPSQWSDEDVDYATHEIENFLFRGLQYNSPYSGRRNVRFLLYLKVAELAVTAQFRGLFDQWVVQHVQDFLNSDSVKDYRRAQRRFAEPSAFSGDISSQVENKNNEKIEGRKVDKARKFLIDSEDKAWEMLQNILDNSIILDETTTIEFKNWPVIEFKVQGRRWQSSMPTRIMPPILELQKDLYRAYARVHYGSNEIRRLSDDEREALEIVVKVSQGSSEFMALIEGAMNTFVDGAVAKMTSEHMVITVIGLALVVAGRLSWKDWLNTRLQEKESDDRVKLSQEETRRLEVMSKAMKQQPMIQQFKEEAELTKDQLVKSLDEPDQIVVGEVTLPGSDAKVLVKKERERSKPVRVDGLFRIQEVKPQVASFRLGLKRISDGMELHAEAKDELLNYDMREALKQGEWDRIPIEFSINAYELRGNIINAEVFSVNVPKDKN